MRRATALMALILALLIAGALLFHRGPEAETPASKPRVAEIENAPPPQPPPRIEVAVEAPPVKPPAPPPPAAVPASVPGIVRGRVRLSGKPPAAKRVPMADPHCAALHAEPLLTDDLVADPDGGVKWAFVYVKSGINGQPPAPSALPVTIDQVACMFTPHLAGVQVGQPLLILNSDPVLHNVHGMPFENREFNVGLPNKGLEHRQVFTKREVMVRVKCDIHPWMSAWVGVLDHPYFSVTDGTGSYGIAALPPGRYTIEVWHEKFASVQREVDVTAAGDVVLDFVLDGKK